MKSKLFGDEIDSYVISGVEKTIVANGNLCVCACESV